MIDSYEWVPLLESGCPEMRGPHGNETDPAESRVVSVEVRFPGERTSFYAGWLTAAAAARLTLLTTLAGADGRSTVMRAIRLCDGTRTVTFPATVLGQAIVSVSEAHEWDSHGNDEAAKARSLRMLRDEAAQNAAASALLIKRG